MHHRATTGPGDPPPSAVDPHTGLAAAQPRHCLLTDDDLVRLAGAEAMFRGHWEAERLRESLAAAGLEHGYTLAARMAV